MELYGYIFNICYIITILLMVYFVIPFSKENSDAQAFFKTFVTRRSSFEKTLSGIRFSRFLDFQDSKTTMLIV
jgi:hypothetical protein